MKKDSIGYAVSQAMDMEIKRCLGKKLPELKEITAEKVRAHLPESAFVEIIVIGAESGRHVRWFREGTGMIVNMRDEKAFAGRQYTVIVHDIVKAAIARGVLRLTSAAAIALQQKLD